MPVKYLVNVPKNNLVFSLHVLRDTFGGHCAHVALQGNHRAADVCSHLDTFITHRNSHTQANIELLLTFRWHEFFPEPKYLQLFKVPGDGSPRDIKLFKLIIHKIC